MYLGKNLGYVKDFIYFCVLKKQHDFVEQNCLDPFPSIIENKNLPLMMMLLLLLLLLLLLS